MSKTAVSQVNIVRVLPVSRYSPLDSVQLDLRPFAEPTPRPLAKAAGVPLKVATKVVATARRGALFSAAQLSRMGIQANGVRRLVNAGLFARDPRIAITDVQPAGGRVMSDRPFQLRVWVSS